MNRQAITHHTHIPYAYARNENHLYIRIRVAQGDAKLIRVFYKDRYNFKGFYKIITLKKSFETGTFDFYDTEISIHRNRYAYYFEILDQEGTRWYFDERGLRQKKDKLTKPFQFPFIAKDDLYQGEDWLKSSICYQIFPDRFFRQIGEKTQKNIPLTPWGETPKHRSFFGGDIPGIIEKIPYLKELGITLLYLTPLFSSSSNHKYNTRDYYSIDESFGTLEETKNMVASLHQVGIRVVFDAVFNHTGHDFFAFQDLLKNQEASRYRHWYYVDSFPVSVERTNYYTFANFISAMPKLNLENQEAREYFLDVARYWIKEVDIDGYRLDVCDELSHGFLMDLKKAVKETKKDAVLIGEIQHESEAFLQGRELDSIMNYPFRDAMVDFFAKGNLSSADFLEILVRNQVIYREEITLQMLNLLDSHDTPRFLTESRGNKQRLKLATAFQLLYQGVPYLYYGDEIGLKGGNDPLCRGTMVWEEERQDRELFNFFKDMISIRKKHQVLTFGDFKITEVSEKAFSFTRNLPDQNKGAKVFALFNGGGDSVSLKGMKGRGKDLISRDCRNLTQDIILDPLSFKVFLIQEENA